MTTPRKVKASAGAEWLLGGFGLLRKAPVPLALLGLIFGIVSLLPALLSQAVGALGLVGQVVVMAISPVLLGGLMYATREVDQGRTAAPGHLLQGFQSGKAFSLMAQLVPQLAALVVLMVLLVVFIGTSGLEAFAAVMNQAQQQGQVDPQLAGALPMGGLGLWMLSALLVGLAVFVFTFLFTPQVMLRDVAPFEAMRRSLRACLRNIPALLVFVVLLVLVVALVMLAVNILALIVSIVAGAMAGQVVSQLLMMAVLMPVYSGAVYVAWQQLLADPAVAVEAPPAPPASGIEL